MLKTLMAALDGTASSDPVLDLGIAWAKATGATLAALAVVDEPSLHGSEELLVGEAYFRNLNRELLAELRGRADAALGRYAIRCAEAGVPFKPLEEEGDPAGQILEEAQRFDLILLARQPNFRVGWTGFDAETPADVLKNAPRPVVVVPDGPTPDPAGPAVIAYDGSLQAARALASFQALGLGAGRSVHVVAAGPDGRRQADRALDYLGSHGVRAQAHSRAETGTPADYLLERVGALGAGLLVMGAYGQPRLREFLLGSTTRTLLAKCPVPVFLDH